MILIIHNLLTALTAFFSTRYLIPLFIKIAHKLDVLDKPDGKLKTHKQAVPYLGGLAVYGGYIIALALFFPFESQAFLFFIGTTLLLFVGLIDDIIPLSPSQKFLGQILATICFLKAGLYAKELFFGAHECLLRIALKVLSAFWMLTIINSFNLLDIMDGLASLIALNAATGFYFIAVVLGLHNVTVLLSAFIGAVFAFWIINKPQASMYLGDAGSLFLGGFLATVPFMIPWGTYFTYGLLAVPVIMAFTIWEVCLLIIIRSYKGIPFYQGSPHHFAHYLRRKGWSPQQILTVVAVLGFVLNAIAYLLALKGMFAALLLFFLCALLWSYLVFA